MAKHAMKIILPLLCLAVLLSACQTQSAFPPGQVEFQGEDVPTGPLPRGQEEVQIDIEPIDDVEVNDEGYPAKPHWKSVSGAALLVSDEEKAARMYLPIGEKVNLPLLVQTEIEVLEISEEGTVTLLVNGEQSQALSVDEDQSFENGQIIIYVAEVHVK